MEENGSIRDDMKLPSGTDESEKLADQIKADFAEGKEIIVSVLKVGTAQYIYLCPGLSCCFLGILLKCFKCRLPPPYRL